MKDLSVILPYYKRLEAFKQALVVNHDNLRSVSGRPTEVVLVLDEPSEESAVLGVVGAYPGISWRVLINRREHKWRNPAIPINVGIRHASGEYVLITSPESLYVTNVPEVLYNSTCPGSNCFSLGYVHFCERHEIARKGLARAYEEGTPKMYYGSICGPREAFEKIRGYDESNHTWGGDDDNCRARLTMLGLQRGCIPSAKMLHPLEPGEPTSVAKLRIKTPAERDAFVHPKSAVTNDQNWGREFEEIIFDYART